MEAFEFGGHVLQLLAERCAFWTGRRTLLLADLHLGKSATFRAAGVPVPEGATAEDLGRLRTVALRTGAAEIIVVGDLFHAAAGLSAEVLRILREWRHDLTIPLRLLPGNHDRKVIPPADCGLELLPSRWAADGLEFVHNPAEASPNRSTICGHLHPVVTLPGHTGGRHRPPCFWRTGNVFVLPSFSLFTGGAAIAPQADDAVFAIAEQRIFPVPARLLQAKRSLRC